MEEEYTCQYCESDFDSQIDCDNHEDCCEENPYAWECEYCNATFTKEGLEAHEDYCPEGWECAYCWYKGTRFDVEEHEGECTENPANQEEDENEEEEYECAFCDYTFSDEDEANEHEEQCEFNPKNRHSKSQKLIFQLFDTLEV